MTAKIKMEFVQTNYQTRFPCHVCGGQTDRVSVLCVCTEADFESFRICETCLREGNIDERLEARAARLESSAAKTRQLIGRLAVPSYQSWQKVHWAVNHELTAAREEEVPF